VPSGLRPPRIRTRALVLGVAVVVLAGVGLLWLERPRLGPSAPAAPPSPAARPAATFAPQGPGSAPGATGEGATAPGAQAAERARCLERIEATLRHSPLPGAPRVEARRAELLARAKGEPVLFLAEPRYVGQVSRGLENQRRYATRTLFPRDTVLGILRHFGGLYPELRQLLLRDGYFYADDPAAAREFTTRVALEDLFREPELVLERGAERFELRRGEGRYLHAGGQLAGTRARLLLFDRVWVRGQEPGPSLHVDVRELAAREGFSRLEVEHLAPEALVVRLRFGEHWARAHLLRDGPRLSLDCLAVEPEVAQAFGRSRDQAARRARALHTLREVIGEQIRAGLPFDEPLTEYGQQDGKLRARWEQAYFVGRDRYSFNDDEYAVFDAGGRPLTPQVCIDFVTETLERASGMHFSPRGQPPRKIAGALDFDTLLGGLRRQEQALRQYAREHPDELALLDYPVARWERYEKVRAFFAFVERERDQLRPGDVVIIRGRANWDRYREEHTHTLLVYESDPVTGMPILLAGNSGTPRLVTWDEEMLRAPKRSIRHRLRPSTDWLYDNFSLREPGADERAAAPLVVEPG
jgi:hypothetical protein